jgi:hypothetical protein
MPPTKALKPELIDIIQRWVAAGAPNTAADAAALSPSTSPAQATPSTPEGATPENTPSSTSEGALQVTPAP